MVILLKRMYKETDMLKKAEAGLDLVYRIASHVFVSCIFCFLSSVYRAFVFHGVFYFRTFV